MHLWLQIAISISSRLRLPPSTDQTIIVRCDNEGFVDYPTYGSTCIPSPG